MPEEAVRRHLVVDQSLCQGHARCYAIAPELFVVDDVDGHARAVEGDVPPELVEKAERAVQSCPEWAISFAE